MVLVRALPLLVIGCVTAPPAAVERTGSPIAVALMIDGPALKEDAQRIKASDDFAARLRVKNHQLNVLSVSALEGARSQTQRIHQLNANSQAEWTALIEVNPRYLNPSAGRFRWETAVRLALVQRGSKVLQGSAQFTLPAHLTRSNQDAFDALDAVLNELSERLELLIDRTLESTTQSLAPRLFYLALVDRFADGDPSK